MKCEVCRRCVCVEEVEVVVEVVWRWCRGGVAMVWRWCAGEEVKRCEVNRCRGQEVCGGAVKR